MKILLLGATGKVGRLVMARALEQGHHVTALVRNPAKITTRPELLDVKQGNLKDPQVMGEMMAGVDAVVSTLGHTSLSKSSIQSAAIRAVLANIKPGQRVISLTGHISDPQDPPMTWGNQLITSFMKRLPGDVYKDAAEHARLLRESNVDWVLVRSPVMTDGRPTKPYRTGYLRIGLFTRAKRADVAEFIVANLADDTWIRQSPYVASQ